MGVVYRAQHLHLQRTVALKLLAPDLAHDSAFRERFLRESRLAAQIVHPNVVTVFDAGEAEGLLWISMQFVDGVDLSTLLRRDGPLEPGRAAEALGEIAAALEAAHARGLVHRDVKPANVLVAPERCYLTDFGLTKRVKAATAFTQTGQFVGTIDYVAPEQIQGGALDARTDVYSLGCVLYECLTGSRPFPRDSDVAVIYAHLEGEPPRPSEGAPSGCGEAIDAVVARAMAKRPEERYASAAELAAAALEAVEADRQADATHVRPGAARERSSAPTRALPAEPGTRAASADPGTRAASPDPGTRAASAGPTRRAPAARTRAEPARGTAAGAPARPASRAPDRPPSAAPQPAGARPRRPRRLALLGALALLAAAGAGIALALGGGGGGGGEEPSRAGDPARNPFAGPLRTTETRVGSRPYGIGYGAGGLWVATFDDQVVQRVRPGGRPSGQTAATGPGPFSLAVGGNAVWVANSDAPTLTRVEPDTLEAASVDLPGAPIWVAIGAGKAWAVLPAQRSVVPVDTRTLAVGTPVRVGRQPRGVATTPSAVYVSNSGEASVTQLDAGSGRVVRRRIPVGRDPNAMAVAAGMLWVVNRDDDSVSRVDLASGEPAGEAIRVGDDPFGIAYGEGLLWVTNAEDDTVTRIDPESGRTVGDPVPVGDQPTNVRAGGGAIWVANNDGGTVSRIVPER